MMAGMFAKQVDAKRHLGIVNELKSVVDLW